MIFTVTSLLASMKKRIITILLSCWTISLSAQTDLSKISTEIRRLSGEWLTNFDHIKGAIKSDSEVEAVYYSRMKLSGSSDSSNLIHYTKDRDIWSFTVDFDKEKMTAAQLDSVIKEIVFFFGKAKTTTTDIDWGYGYVPANKKGASEKLRCFYLLVFDRLKDPKDKTGGRLTLTVGDDNYFRAR